MAGDNVGKSTAALLFLVSVWLPITHACTSIIIGKKATTDGSVMTTHNNDCTDCDIRIVRVPGRTYKEKESNSSCPVWPCKFSFPRFIGQDRGEAYTPQSTDAEKVDGDFQLTRPFKYIEQVEQTYSYLDGTYGLVNEHGVAMGESTCAAKLVAYGYPRGDALFDVSALGRIALERCKTARCAVKVMGQLGEQYGYYGANDPLEEGMGMYEEAGEAMTVIDATGESWVFHILPDDSGRSAIWAAQRVPDDHIAVVANSFIIREMDLHDSDNFLFSANMVDIAVRKGFWDANVKPFNFALAYSPDGADAPGWGLRRTWRIFDLVAPSLKLDPDTKTPLPFSIKPERKISLNDFFAFNRDRFEGSKFDLSVGPASGPWGNPNRYDPSGRPEYRGGYFERAISLHRTTYSFVAQARPWLAKSKASTVLWFAQHSPHSSLFVPFYAATTSMPKEYESGNLFRLERSSAWWAFAAVNNFAEKQYSFMYQDISALQKKYEGEAQEKIKSLDDEITQADSNEKALSLLTEYSVSNARARVREWWHLLDFLFTKYRDGARLEKFAPPVDTMPLFYPSWWLGQVGYYNNGPMPPLFSWVPPEVPPPPHPDEKPWILTQSASVDVASIPLERISQFTHAAVGKRLVNHQAAQSVLYDENALSVSSIHSSVSNQQAERIDPVTAMDATTMALGPQAVSALTVILLGAALVVGFFAGRTYEKRQDYLLVA